MLAGTSFVLGGFNAEMMVVQNLKKLCHQSCVFSEDGSLHYIVANDDLSKL